MFELITKKISNKIIFSLLVLLTISTLTIVYFSTKEVSRNTLQNTKENLEMLNAAMFQSLRNAMNTGDPATIKQAEEDARNIKGVKDLTVAKSKKLMELYPSDTKFTTDPNILKAFDTKEPLLLETDNEKTGHSLRMIKPMVATQDCLLCHANQQEGDVIGVMDLTFSLDEADQEVWDLLVHILVVATITGWITIGFVFFIVKRATNTIGDLKTGFSNLLESNDPSITLDVQSNDEVGEVADLFNAYMDKVRAGLKKDAVVIEEANDILEKTASGFFVYQVQSNASNPHVENLKNQLNDMIKHTKETLDKINETLRKYSESKFDYKIDDKGIYGDLGSLASGIKLVGNNTSEILAMIMNTGDSLNENTKILSEASKNLSDSSNRQAASLEETAAALEQITANIQSNTQASVRMSQLAQNVTSSAKKGETLANQTASAMDEISHKVNSINEAIDVIDQIAFQTNILSLNAAVEASTAGEAGKGFAVVAQEVRNLANRSAEAAKDIKDLVEDANLKSTEGKKISDDMIEGYKELNTNISDTTITIEEVATASKEQEKGIVQINDAVNTLDRATQQNAQVAGEISGMSEKISDMSNSLVTAASRASFLEESLNKVCDVDLVYDTAELKVDLLNRKDETYSKLGSYSNWQVKEENTLKQWFTKHEQSGKKLNTNTMNELHSLTDQFRNDLQSLVDSNSNKEDNKTLNDKAKNVEVTTLKIFGNLNQLKEDACKD